MQLINKWKHKLGLDDWFITTEAISNNQVTYPND